MKLHIHEMLECPCVCLSVNNYLKNVLCTQPSDFNETSQSGN